MGELLRASVYFGSFAVHAGSLPLLLMIMKLVCVCAVHSKKGAAYVEGLNVKNALDKEHESKSFGYILTDLVQPKPWTKPLAGILSPFRPAPSKALQRRGATSYCEYCLSSA